MKKRLAIHLIFLLLCLTTEVAVSSARIQGVRIWPSPESTRVVFDLSEPVEYLEKAESGKILIQFKAATSQFDFSKLPLENTRIKKITRQFNQGNLEVVLLLEQPLKPNSFTLLPNRLYGHRLVIDLEVNERATEAELDKVLTVDQTERERILALFQGEKTKEMPLPSLPAPATTLPAKTCFVVAIDAGHGGEDPGAIGRHGTREKDVVLGISRYLKEMIDKEPNMKATLIRAGDYYVGLRERVMRARKQKADLFISIHADAFHDIRAKGASVFTLSEKGASSVAARWLAERENRSDLVGGLCLKGKNKMLASVLLDLSQSASKEEGHKAALHVLRAMGRVGELHRGHVEQAGFMVLKAPDIPSLLVETGFISHPPTERKLRMPEHQKRIAASILQGIRIYARQKPHS